MSEPIIRVENLGKKYLIRHQQQEPYTALRDVITNGVKSLGRTLVNGTGEKRENPSREEFWALKDVSFEIHRGDRVGIIGRNGAGKSTLLKILSRITEPTTGKIHMKGRVASLLEVGTGFHPELTGRENIYLNGAILGMSKVEIKKKFDEIVAFAEVEKFLDTPVKRYSSGMYVRLAFAVAAHLEPEILIVDEVLAVGDLSFQKKSLGKMGKVAEGGRTVIFVSHNMSAIRKLCEKTIYLDRGNIVRMGATPEVVLQYEQGYIADLNLLETVARRNKEQIEGLDFYIKSVQVVDIEGRATREFRYNQNLELIVQVEGRRNEGIFSLEFYIYHYGEENTLVCMGSGDHHDKYFDMQIKKVSINVGPLALTEAEYVITLSLIYREYYGAGINRVDQWSQAVSFKIVHCHPFGTDCVLRADYDQGVCVIGQSFNALV